ncbi:MAG TPA: hydroxymethylbilane synthase [Pyrinomonadaceae bacterium]|jgi:hydroxymethylbilane synthase|nr:hydroxymethylbilane synthase [Pyrinomonadaceae bacterium]
MKDRLVIGSRGSKLALWQAEWVRSRLAALHPQTRVRIEVIKTSGDFLKEAPLSVIGGKGVFTKEIEEALLAGRIDLAVHSLKDLPTVLPDGLSVAATPEREDARDALVLRPGLSMDRPAIGTLPSGAVAGTSSPRRLAQLKHLRPDLVVKELRGNVDTRLRKLDAGDYDCVILAAAGLRRLGFAERIDAAIPIDEMLPAVSQGALGLETRAHDSAVIELLAPLDHEPTRLACTAERALLRGLGGGCQLPIAAHAAVSADHMRLEGLASSLSGDILIREALEGRASDAAELGETLARRLLERGAGSLLAGFMSV